MAEPMPGRRVRPAPVSRRARPSKAPLSREVIIDTGLRVLDAEGLAALTMRRVAQELDTGAASLYVYVANRDDLMAAMLDHVLGSAAEPDDGIWRERLIAIIESTVAVMSRHEGLAFVALASAPTGANALRLIDRMRGLLADAGVDERTVDWAVELLYLHITAAAAEQSAGHAARASGTRRLGQAEPVAGRTPMTAPARRSGDGDTRASWAVRALIDGILATPAR
ncbi:TetR/AcrR family transcriptional regulator [Nocardia aurea]|uniref:TetR/AcrR family transcriptional regulator n=1 Tax=Nocardia aurea TaxID=2144174 RepID=A0ABV3FLH2_9NOCA